MFWNDPGFLADFCRGFLAILDSIGYFFLGGIFNIFFIVANASFFQGDVINTFYSRVQMILGVFMIFRLTLTFLEIIVNPDLYKDRQKGAASLVKRIAIMLVLLSVIVPIDIPNTDNNSLNEQISKNGILFGLLYQVQNSVVEDNILGKLILGYNLETDGNLQLGGGMSSVGDVITSQIARTFITPTLNDGYDDVAEITENNVEEATKCPTDARSYMNTSVTSGALLDHINDTCDSSGTETYAFNYTGFGGVVVAIVMTIIIVGFTLDVAVRAIKLALLRLIAPIPIISYISPGQEKDGAFGNWVKTLTSTYLSLFIRLIIIYFGIYLIILLREGNLVTLIGTSNFITSALANIFIIIGILVFMKDAPKFFQDMLGIKGDGKLFSGIGTMLGAAALGGSLVGSVSSAAKTGYAEGQEMGHGKFRSGLRGIGAGIGGFLGGTYLGGKALMTNDKKQASAVRAAMQKGIVRRGSGSTFFGRTKEGVYSMLTGSSLADKYDTKIQAYNDYSDLFSAFDAKADADSVRRYTFNGETNTVKGFKEQYELLRDANADETTLKAALDRYKDAKKQLQTDVITGAYNDTSFAKQMRMDYDNAQKIRRGAGLDLGDVVVGENGIATEADKFKVESFNAKDAIRNLKQDTKYKASNANKKYNS